MEEHKSELKEKSLDDSMEIDQYDTQQADLERADQQVGRSCQIDLWPLTLKFDRSTWPFLKIDMGYWAIS